MQTQMTTVFERIPDLFVELYDAEFRRWAKGFRKVGRVAAFKLHQPVEPLVISSDPRRIIGVRLQADLDTSNPARPRMVIRPQTEDDEDAIRRHVFDMRARTLN